MDKVQADVRSVSPLAGQIVIFRNDFHGSEPRCRASGKERRWRSTWSD